MSLPGKWRPVRAELDGQPAPDLALDRMEFHLTATDYTVHFGGQPYDRGTYAATSTMLHLTAQQGPNAGRVIAAIYQLAGDRLRICYGLDGTAPDEFKTSPGSARYLVTYRRHTT
jgi:uncharacterized protein (TIGR03067 family)